MFKASSCRYPQPHRNEISHLTTWLVRCAGAQRGTFYFLTLTFDRYRNRYLVAGGDDCLTTREEVMAGLTRAMPAIQTRQAYIKDLDRFYVRLLRALLGSRYCKLSLLQPVAVGALDQPAYKRTEKCSLLSRRPGERFDHAHLVVFVADAPLSRSEETIAGKFERFWNDDLLHQLWRETNPNGEVHLKLAADVHGALDYAAKTAKLSTAFHDHILMWPLRAPKRR